STLMSSFQRFGDLRRYRQCFINQDRTTSQSFLKSLSVHQFHHDALLRGGIFESVDLGNIRMVHRSEQLSFTLEPSETFRIAGQVMRQKLQSNIALQLDIVRAEHHTHAPFTQW